MRASGRPPCPAILAEHGATWSSEYARRRAENPSYRFQWKTHDGERVNKLIEPALKAMTAEHCAYCDGFPFDMAQETIDHFLPKSQYPALAYEWANLYLACSRCQSVKASEFDSIIQRDTYQGELLRPDEDQYTFERYFLFNFQTGEIEVNLSASAEERERAAYTIRCFGWNEERRQQARKRQVRRFKSAPKDDRQHLDEWPYRFVLEILTLDS